MKNKFSPNVKTYEDHPAKTFSEVYGHGSLRSPPTNNIYMLELMIDHSIYTPTVGNEGQITRKSVKDLNLVRFFEVFVFFRFFFQDFFSIFFS